MRGQRTRSAAVLLTAAVLLLGACAGSSGGKQAAPSTTAMPAVQVKPTFDDGATGVPIDGAVGINVVNGKLSSVAVTTPAGPAPGGALAADKTGWLLSGGFTPNTAYTVAATVTDLTGARSSHEYRFTTGPPKAELHTTLNVGDGGVYGVGMPVIVQLSHPVSEEKRAALTQRLTVTADRPVNGAWRWFSDSEVHWRPQVYWTTGTKVSLKIDFAGFDAGDGVWGVDGRTVAFSIGDAHISTVDTVTHQMTVTNNGQVVRAFPVSTGRDDKYPTKSGIHVVNEKAQKVIMDSATVGIPRNSPDGYYETVFWNVRISNSGEFVHAAPWSVGSQGNANVSHGCVNASDADAEWFYNFSQNGDVVVVNGSSEQLQPWNGYGDWQIPFDQWAN